MLTQTLRLLFLLSLAGTVYGAIGHTEQLLDAQGHPLDDPRYDDIRRWHEMEVNGLSLFQGSEYRAAYDALKVPAQHGFKRAQHALAVMHINGYAAEKNVLVGVALLGLAAENGDRKLQREYKKALKVLPKKYQPLVRDQTSYYIARYGMQAQGISCRRVKRVDSNMKQLRCVKQPGNYEVWEWAP